MRECLLLEVDAKDAAISQRHFKEMSESEVSANQEAHVCGYTTTATASLA